MKCRVFFSIACLKFEMIFFVWLIDWLKCHSVPLSISYQQYFDPCIYLYYLSMSTNLFRYLHLQFWILDFFFFEINFFFYFIFHINLIKFDPHLFCFSHTMLIYRYINQFIIISQQKKIIIIRMNHDCVCMCVCVYCKIRTLWLIINY